MLKSCLKTALRNLRLNLTYSVINVVGLAVGLTCFLLIMFYIYNEFQYDQFHSHADRIFRITSHRQDENSTRSYARSNPAIAPTLLNEFSEVERTIRFQRYNGAIRFQDKSFNEDKMFFAENSIFDIFTFPLTKGNPKTALRDANTAVLTESTAQRYFGQDDPIGKTIVMADTLYFTITGVAANPPSQSHLQFEILLSFKTYQNIQAGRGRILDELWTSGTFYTYALLTSQESAKRVESQFPAYLERYIGDQSNSGTKYSIALQPLTDIRLHSDLRQELAPNGSLMYIYIFLAVAFFILIISCINFINLETARSVRRAREVGIRKVVGAGKSQLVLQFLSETIILSVIALGIAWLTIVFAIPWFNNFSGSALELDLVTHWWYLPATILLSIVIGIFAGMYPAFMLSAYQPIKVLKGTISVGRQDFTLAMRKGLVVFQFSLSILIASSTIIAFQQVEYLRNRNLGFDNEQMLVLPFNWDQAVQNKYETLKTELLRLEAVKYVTASGDVPGRMFTGMSYWIEGLPIDESRGINALIADPDFAETYNLEIVAGRDFSVDIAANLGETFVLNTTAVSEMGFKPEEIIGKRFRMNTEGVVIGVVNDFHFEGLQNELEPLVMTVWPSWFGYISIKLNTSNLPETISNISLTWKRMIPNRPFEYFFLDDDFKRQYQSEERFGEVFMTFSLLAIFISCLGLFGLASYTAQQRTKEIGIRKIVGATATSIVLLLSKSFTKLLLIATMLAAPAGFLGMNRWLQSFAYRIDIHWSVFLYTAIGAILIMWLTISFQSLKAAMTNPVRSLRYE